MDEKDIKIIEILEENARVPFTTIAKKVNLSEGAVRKRVEALEREGIIRKYVAILDPKKLGYSTITILGLDVDPTKLLDVAKEIARMDEAKMVCLSTGDHMVMVEIWARDGRELSEILSNKIGKIEGVRRLCPAILLEKIKGL